MTAKSSLRDLVAFWIFGFANNYAYVVMLSAADDLISSQDKSQPADSSTAANASLCQEKITKRTCNEVSTGGVLLADILPCLIIKILAPFFMHRLPFGLRHFLVCLSQALSFIIVAYSSNIYMTFLGIILASLGSGFGESCYLALAAHYPKSSISLWSSGTGGAGVAGSFAYALLRESKLLGLSTRDSLLAMLVIPAIFAITYWFLLTNSPSVYRAKILDPRTWIVPKSHRPLVRNGTSETIKTSKYSHVEKYAEKKRNLTTEASADVSSVNDHQASWIKLLLRYMIPLGVVYFAEYLINQGIVELFVFDCSHGFSFTKASQYRWYQVLYQVGVFISRSSVNFFELSALALYLLPVLQTFNLVLFFFNALYSFIPHIVIVFAFILFEGLFGGASYVNTFNRIYKEVPIDRRELCLSVATLSDSVGTALAGFSALPLHNYICSLNL